jgi:hypothetical protein
VATGRSAGNPARCRWITSVSRDFTGAAAAAPNTPQDCRAHGRLARQRRHSEWSVKPLPPCGTAPGWTVIARLAPSLVRELLLRRSATVPASRRGNRSAVQALPQTRLVAGSYTAVVSVLVSIHPRPAPFTGGHPDEVRAGREPWRTLVNAGVHCWKACWCRPGSPPVEPPRRALLLRPILGAEWERRSSVRCVQTRSTKPTSGR